MTYCELLEAIDTARRLKSDMEVEFELLDELQGDCEKARKRGKPTDSLLHQIDDQTAAAHAARQRFNQEIDFNALAEQKSCA